MARIEKRKCADGFPWKVCVHVPNWSNWLCFKLIIVIIINESYSISLVRSKTTPLKVKVRRMHWIGQKPARTPFGGHISTHKIYFEQPITFFFYLSICIQSQKDSINLRVMHSKSYRAIGSYSQTLWFKKKSGKKREQNSKYRTCNAANIIATHPVEDRKFIKYKSELYSTENFEEKGMRVGSYRCHFHFCLWKMSFIRWLR